MFNNQLPGAVSPQAVSGFIPMVRKQGPGGMERYSDIYSMMLEQRVIFLLGQVEDNMANSIVAQMLYLESIDKKKPINLYINSPGGSVTAGLSIYDTMQYISCPVHTTVNGQAASMGAFILNGGEPGHRAALPNSRIMIHQPLGGYQGQATDIEIHTKEILNIRAKLNSLMAHHCGQDINQITIDTDRDNFMNPETALGYGKNGLIDKIVENRNAV